MIPAVFQRWAALLLTAVLLAGCQLLTDPVSQDKLIASGYLAVEGAKRQAAEQLYAQQLTPTQARAIQNVTDEALVFLDDAKAARDAGDEVNATRSLALARAILAAIERGSP